MTPITDQPCITNQPASLAEDLLALAAEKSSQRRLELLRRITDAYLNQSSDGSAAERYLLNEVVEKLVARLTGDQRAEASEFLSHLPELPEQVADAFAQDADSAVSSPMLRNYDGLREQLLVRIASGGSSDQLAAIAARRLVTPPVTDVVVTRGDSHVVSVLAGNAGAQFSQSGMMTLINRAQSDPTLQALIVERRDLTPEALAKLLPMISEKLAERLRGVDVVIDDDQVKRHVGEWVADRRNNAARVDDLIVSIEKRDLSLPNVCMEMIRGRRLLDAAHVLAAAIDIDRNYAFGILTEGKTDVVLMLFRSIELPWRVAHAFITLRDAKTRRGPASVAARERDYLAMDVAATQRVVRFLKVRRSALAEELPFARSA